jgi:hypothetical protein
MKNPNSNLRLRSGSAPAGTANWRGVRPKSFHRKYFTGTLEYSSTITPGRDGKKVAE